MSEIRYKGQEIYNLAKQLFPYCRSITGQGVRDTLQDLSMYIKRDTNLELVVHSIPSGTRAFDWVIPKEWTIREAYIEDENGDHIIDMQQNNLHIMGYSIPMDQWLSLDELKKYIYTQPEQPDAIPYVTSYYKEQFGFCMSENQKNALKPGKYHLYIDGELKDGNLNYGEVVIPGESEKEVFFSTYICHPSMANNECSGPALSAELVRYIASIKKRKYTYRFVYIPETIGSLAYMSVDDHLSHMKEHIIAGFNLSCVGDDRDYSIVESRYGNTLADKVLKKILSDRGGRYSTYSYLHRGSDERQYNAPGIDLPVVCFCRSKFGEYPEYHTSDDNMGLVSPSGFQGSYEIMTDVIQILEHNAYYKMAVLGEPQLGKRGLYPTTSQKGSYDAVMAMMNFIAYADGRNDLIDISNIIGVKVKNLIEVIEKLMQNDLLQLECE